MSEKIIDAASGPKSIYPQLWSHFHYTTSGMPMEVLPLQGEAPLPGFHLVELKLLGRTFVGMSYEALEAVRISESLAFKSGHENQPHDLIAQRMKVLCIETGRVRTPCLRIALLITSLEELSKLFATRKVSQ